MKVYEMNLSNEELEKKVRKKFIDLHIDLDMGNPIHRRLYLKFKSQVKEENKELVKIKGV